MTRRGVSWRSLSKGAAGTGVDVGPDIPVHAWPVDTEPQQTQGLLHALVPHLVVQGREGPCPQGHGQYKLVDEAVLMVHDSPIQDPILKVEFGVLFAEDG